jgi:hypothetical protein
MRKGSPCVAAARHGRELLEHGSTVEQVVHEWD